MQLADDIYNNDEAFTEVGLALASRRSPISLDLPATNGTGFSLNVEIPDEHSAAVLKRFGVTKALLRKQEPSFVHQYTKSRRRHEAFGHFYTPRGRADALRCHIRFDLEPLEYEQSRKFDELLAGLEERQMTVLAHCDATFRYELETVDTIVPLPWRLLNEESAPFDEIRGFRAVKLAGDQEIRFSAIVDMGGQDKLDASVSFDEAGVFSFEFVRTAFLRAVDYAGRLVRPMRGE